MNNQGISKEASQIKDIKILAMWIQAEADEMEAEIRLGLSRKAGRKVARWAAELNEMVQSLSGEALEAEQ